MNCDTSGVGAQLVTHHNIAYMLRLVRTLRSAIIEGTFPHALSVFLSAYFGGIAKVPMWVTDALNAVNIHLSEVDSEVMQTK